MCKLTNKYHIDKEKHIKHTQKDYISKREKEITYSTPKEPLFTLECDDYAMKEYDRLIPQVPLNQVSQIGHLLRGESLF